MLTGPRSPPFVCCLCDAIFQACLLLDTWVKLSQLFGGLFSRNLPRFAHEPPSKWRHAKFFFLAKEAGCMLLNANILGSADSQNSGRVQQSKQLQIRPR